MKNSEELTARHNAHISIKNMLNQSKLQSISSLFFPPIFKNKNIHRQINFISNRKVNTYPLKNRNNIEELRQRAMTNLQKNSRSPQPSQSQRYSSLMNKQQSEKSNKRTSKQQRSELLYNIQQQLQSKRYNSFTNRNKRPVIEMKSINLLPDIPDFKDELVQKIRKSLIKNHQKNFDNNYQYIKNISQQISKFQTIQTRPSMFEIVDKKKSVELDPISKKCDTQIKKCLVHKKQYKSMTLQVKNNNKKDQDQGKIQITKKLNKNNKIIERQISEEYRYEPWHFQAQIQSPYESNQELLWQ